MNYSKNLNKTAITRRVILLIVGALVTGVIIGVSGYAIKTHITANKEEKGVIQTNESSMTQFVIYGAYDDRHITQEVFPDWGKDEDNFTSLDVSLNADIQKFTYYLCSAYDIDFSLIVAIMQLESDFQVDVISETDDYGLMQINSCNHAQLTEILGLTNYLDPYENIRAGCFMIRKLFEKYKNTNMVLMAYNMGEGGASTLWKQGIYNTDYTDNILNIRQQLNEELKGR